MRPDRQVIADSHRQAVGDQVGCADNQDDAQRETTTRHTGDDRKRRDDAVVRAVDQLTNVVAGNLKWTRRFDMQRLSRHLSSS